MDNHSRFWTGFWNLFGFIVIAGAGVLLIEDMRQVQIEAKSPACECATGAPCECCRCPAVKH